MPSQAPENKKAVQGELSLIPNPLCVKHKRQSCRECSGIHEAPSAVAATGPTKGKRTSSALDNDDSSKGELVVLPARTNPAGPVHHSTPPGKTLSCSAVCLAGYKRQRREPQRGPGPQPSNGPTAPPSTAPAAHPPQTDFAKKIAQNLAQPLPASGAAFSVRSRRAALLRPYRTRSRLLVSDPGTLVCTSLFARREEALLATAPRPPRPPSQRLAATSATPRLPLRLWNTCSMEATSAPTPHPRTRQAAPLLVRLALQPARTLLPRTVPLPPPSQSHGLPCLGQPPLPPRPPWHPARQLCLAASPPNSR